VFNSSDADAEPSALAAFFCIFISIREMALFTCPIPFDCSLDASESV